MKYLSVTPDGHEKKKSKGLNFSPEVGVIGITGKMVTSLRQWMAAEEFDKTEPVEFYVAGARGWDDPLLNQLWSRRRAGLEEDRLYPTPEALQLEE